MRTVVRYSEAFKMEVMRGLETGRRESIGAARRAYGIRGSITANPTDTVVRGNAAYNLASNSVFIVNTNCTILNLTIRHGKATYGGGISCSALATYIVVSNNAYLTIMGNTTNAADTIVQASNDYNIASTRVFDVRTNCVIRNMTVHYGRLTSSASGAGILASGMTVVSNCIVTRNVYSGTGSGGDIYSSNSIMIFDSLISRNVDSGKRGEIGSQCNGVSIVVCNSMIMGNASTTHLAVGCMV